MGSSNGGERRRSTIAPSDRQRNAVAPAMGLSRARGPASSARALPAVAEFDLPALLDACADNAFELCERLGKLEPEAVADAAELWVGSFDEISTVSQPPFSVIADVAPKLTRLPKHLAALVGGAVRGLMARPEPMVPTVAVDTLITVFAVDQTVAEAAMLRGLQGRGDDLTGEFDWAKRLLETVDETIVWVREDGETPAFALLCRLLRRLGWDRFVKYFHERGPDLMQSALQHRVPVEFRSEVYATLRTLPRSLSVALEEPEISKWVIPFVRDDPRRFHIVQDMVKAGVAPEDLKSVGVLTAEDEERVRKENTLGKRFGRMVRERFLSKAPPKR